MSKGLANIEASGRLKQQREAITERENKVEEREKKAKDYEEQLEAKRLLIRQDLGYYASCTFWRRNPHYTFLARGLICGLGVYYGHSRIDALVAGIANLWRKH